MVAFEWKDEGKGEERCAQSAAFLLFHIMRGIQFFYSIAIHQSQ